MPRTAPARKLQRWLYEAADRGGLARHAASLAKTGPIKNVARYLMRSTDVRLRQRAGEAGRAYAMAEDLVCKWQTYPGDASAFLVLPARTDDPIVEAYLRGETPNRYMAEVLDETTAQGDRVVDLGCHVGTFSVAAAAMGRKVTAVDASARHVALVRHSRDLNHFANLEIHHAAISRRAGTVSFLENGLFGAIDFSDSDASAVGVQACGVDDLIREQAGAPVRFLKMDIEGAEYDALVTGNRLLSEDKPIILYESNGPTLNISGHSVQEVREKLESLGYRVFRMEGDRWIYSPPEQVQPEAWVDMLALGESDQTRWASRIEWQWQPKAILRKCQEWAALPYGNTRDHLLAEIRQRVFDPAIDDDISKIRLQLEERG